MEWKLELNLWTKTILTRGSEFLMNWTSWSQTRSTKSTTTTSRRPLRRRRKHLRWKTNVLAFASRSKAKAKPRLTSACSSTRTVPIRERMWTDIEPWTQSNLPYPVAERLNTLLRHGQLLREEDGTIEFWRLKIIFGRNLRTLSIGLMMCGRARWQEAEATRKYFNTVLTRQDKKFFISELFKVIQDAIPLILHYRTMC